jgi:hypothetical protein
MVVPFHRSLESDDASWEFGTELVEIVNPVGSKRSGVADELAPNRSSQPVIDFYIPNRVNRTHVISFYNEQKTRKSGKIVTQAGFLLGASARTLAAINFQTSAPYPNRTTGKTTSIARKNFLLRVSADML